MALDEKMISLLNTWKKGYFTSKEFECKCGCGVNQVNPGFMKKLNTMRIEAGFFFIIVSGCRCVEHNKNIGGKPTSDHLCIPDKKIYCAGADIKVTSTQMAYDLVEMAFWAGFRRIGLAKTFIHVGNRSSNPQRVLWLY